MDLSFARGRAPMVAPQPVELSYARLIAILSAVQAASPTAQLAARLAHGGEAGTNALAALIGMFDPRGTGRGEPLALRGSFNPAVAGKAP